MSEIERIHNDINEGYTVTRFGNTMTLHNQMVDDIKYLHNLSTNNDVSGTVWVVQDTMSGMIAGMFDSQIKAIKYTDKNKGMAIINIEVI